MNNPSQLNTGIPVDDALNQAIECGGVEGLISAFSRMASALNRRSDDVDRYVGQQQSKEEEKRIVGVIDYGPISSLVASDDVNDILVNGPNQVYIERSGKLILTDIKFESDEQAYKLASDIAFNCGRKLESRRPLLDARLLDGSRVNIIAPPLAVDGTIISIRKFSKQPHTLESMVENGSVSESLKNFLTVCAKSRLNIIISGGTGAGKTTLLNAVSQHIPDDERLVTVEDAAELRLQQPHVVRLETRPFYYGMSRDDEVTIRDLVKNALRMRPDRIIVGEVRGAEAFDMMQAMNTGHEGSMCTIHSNHPRDAMSRIENMVTMANLQIPVKSIRYQIASAVNLVVQISRMRDGKRRISHISEVTGMEGEVIVMQDLFNFKSEKENKDGSITGSFVWSGIMPRFVRRAAYHGQIGLLEKALGVKISGL